MEPHVTTFEVITEQGLAYVFHGRIELHYQDNGQTLQVFVGGAKGAAVKNAQLGPVKRG